MVIVIVASLGPLPLNAKKGYKPNRTPTKKQQNKNKEQKKRGKF